MSEHALRLKMLPLNQYRGVNHDDPIRFYYWPLIGPLYRRRVEMCLEECKGGQSVLEIGFGTGLSFLNLDDLYKEIHGLDLTADTNGIQNFFAGIGIQTHLRQGDVLKMPYADHSFDTVLLVSILEHLKPLELEQAYREVRRVLKPGGQMVYGSPVERPLMAATFRVLGYDIRRLHFSTEKEIASAAGRLFQKVRVRQLMSIAGPLYEVGHFIKE